jgi:ABC-type multidrug transport system fused ATPase/permease subunit
MISVSGMIYIRHRYAQCLRDLKRIEGITRSPIYSYLTSTIYGLKVIRSYHAEQLCSEQFLSHLNDNSRVNFLLCTVNRWAGIRFDWLTIFFIGLVTVLAMLVRIVQNYLSAADIALMLTYSLQLMGTLQWTIR